MTKTLEQLENERLEWSRTTFPDATPTSSLLKACEEIKEVAEIINDRLFTKEEKAEEYVDVLMCVFDSAGRLGISADDLRAAYEKKFEKNKARKWVRNPDKTYSHVK